MFHRLLGYRKYPQNFRGVERLTHVRTHNLEAAAKHDFHAICGRIQARVLRCQGAFTGMTYVLFFGSTIALQACVRIHVGAESEGDAGVHPFLSITAWTSAASVS